MPEYEKKCVICGKKFLTFRSYQLTCCEECREKHKKLRKRRYDERVKQKSMGLEALKSNIRVCRMCGREFEYTGKGSGRLCPTCLENQAEYHKRIKELDKSLFKPKLRKCHDCPRLTTDYRCPECLRKWREKHGVRINGYGLDDVVTYSTNTGWKHHGTN